MAEDANADWQLLYNRFGYSLLGRAKSWFVERKEATHAVPFDRAKYNAMLAAFKQEFSRWGASRAEKCLAFDSLRWDPNTENLDSFVRKLKELGADLGRQDEDMRNAFVKAMPSNIVPSIASMDNLDNMIAAAKRLYAFLKMNPQSGLTSNLQSFYCDSTARPSVDFNVGNMIVNKMEKLEENLGAMKLFSEELHSVRSEIGSIRRDVDRISHHDNTPDRGRKRSRERYQRNYRNRSISNGRSPYRSHDARLIEEIHYMVRANRDPSRSYRPSNRDSRYNRNRSNSFGRDRFRSPSGDRYRRDNYDNRYRNNSGGRYRNNSGSRYRENSGGRYRNDNRGREQQYRGDSSRDRDDYRNRSNEKREYINPKCELCSGSHDTGRCMKLIKYLDRVNREKEETQQNFLIRVPYASKETL